MKLYFLRHAVAVKRGTRGFFKDHLRPLTEDGKEKFKNSCEGLERILKPDWDLILTSPFVRARETADVLAGHFNARKIMHETEYLTPGHSTPSLIKAISDHKGAQSIVLVGHEPSLTGHISQLIAGRSDANIQLKKGGLALVEFDRPLQTGSGFLRMLIPPSALLAMAKKK